MAVVFGPLMSVRASGKFAGALVYSNWKTTPYVRRLSIPANPKSPAQLSVRAMNRFLSQYWASLSAAEQATWDTRADNGNYAPFNAFMGYNLQRWGGNNTPSKEDPAGEANTIPVITSLAVAAQCRSILVTVTIGTINDGWGIAISRDTETGVGITRNEIVRIIPGESAAAFTWLDYPLTVGQAYYYSCYAFTDDGLATAAEAEETATPTN